MTNKQIFYIGFYLGFIILTCYESYLVHYLNNYHPLMIPILLILNIWGSYLLGLTACGKFKIF
jgi:hypothetical protein